MQKELLALGFSDPALAEKNLCALMGTFKSIRGFDTLPGELAQLAASSPSPDTALTNLSRVVEALPPQTLHKFLKNGQGPMDQQTPKGSKGHQTPKGLKGLVTVCGSSNMLSNYMGQKPEWFEWLFLDGGLETTKVEAGLLEGLREWTDEALANGADNGEAGFSKALRTFRNREYLRIGSRDLLGLATLRETVTELSALASVSLQLAYEFTLRALKQAHGEPLYKGEGHKGEGGVEAESGFEAEAGFAVIAMGKLGGGELNFSSDIDLIYVYSTERGETTGVQSKTGGKARSIISLGEFFTRLAERLTRLIGQPTEDGFVFRVDLGLRPGGGSGDIASSLRSAELYYESWGRSWERSAMVKARCVAGSETLGVEFQKMITPFVYRRYMDFTAIDEIKSMKEKIDLSLLKDRPDIVDVKLGRGGIREVEFLCQALQLAHGGKNPGLRERSTLKAIETLRAEGLLTKDEASELERGYVFLRTLEHRLQIIDGRQTQAVPTGTAELKRLGRMLGYKGADDFLKEYRVVTMGIHSIFRSLFYGAKEELAEGVRPEVLTLLSLLSPEASAKPVSSDKVFPVNDNDKVPDLLEALGFRDPKGSVERLGRLRALSALSAAPHISAKAAILIERLVPMLIDAASGVPRPDLALKNLAAFLDAAGSRTTLLAMLTENPPLSRQITKIFGTSAFLSTTLIENPEAMDLLLSPEMARPVKTPSEISDELDAELRGAASYEDSLDRLRQFKNRELFRVGTNDLLGELTPSDVSVQLTTLAEATLRAALELARAELRDRYGEPPEEVEAEEVTGGPRFFIIGLGKLGGAELTYGSDLDIAFCYDVADNLSTPEVTAGGRKSVSMHEYFVALTQRVISIMTLKTREGFVFNIDTRLRPSGSSGPLVVSRDSLLGYHRETAEVWERQAMLRARAVAGSLGFGGGVLGELKEIILERGLSAEDTTEMLRIRERMELEIAKEGPSRLDVKTGSGGLVDIEFLVQALQLRRGKEVPEIRGPNTLNTLRLLAKHGLISTQDHETLAGAYAFLRRIETGLRVVGDRAESTLVISTTKEGATEEGDPEELLALARRLGCSGRKPTETLLTEYREKTKKVRAIYTKTMQALRAP